jgi:RimJ/RimL family protein N-acetyltransferase
MEIYLETPRLLLRRFTLDDVDNLVLLDSDPEVMRYLSGGAPTPRDVIERETLPASSVITNVVSATESGRRSRKRPELSSAGSCSAR